MAKGKMSGMTKAILLVIAAIIILYLGIKLANLEMLQIPGETQVAAQDLTIYVPWGNTQLSFGERIMGFLGIMMGMGSTDGQEILVSVFIVSIAIFLIILLAISDILVGFSSFSTPVCWGIGLGLAIVAGVTGIVNALVVLFGVTAGISAIGIAIIIISSIAAAVTLNAGLGGTMRKWRLMRQMEVESSKSYKGIKGVTSAVKSLKEVNREFAKKDAEGL